MKNMFRYQWNDMDGDIGLLDGDFGLRVRLELRTCDSRGVISRAVHTIDAKQARKLAKALKKAAKAVEGKGDE